jgi:hypothetical protein
MKKPAGKSPACKKAAQEIQFFYGWSDELNLAYRQVVRADGTPHGRQEVSDAIDRKAVMDEEPSAFYVATWPDASRYEIADKTNAEVLGLLAGAQHAASKTLVAWEGVVATTKHSIEIKQRKDRHLLLSIYEQAKWIAGVPICNFGVEPMPMTADVPPRPEHVPDDDPRAVAALAFLQPLAEEYCKGEWTAKELTEAKQQKLKEYKKTLPKTKPVPKAKSKPSVSSPTPSKSSRATPSVLPPTPSPNTLPRLPEEVFHNFFGKQW